MSSPRVSVILPVFNGAQWLPDSIGGCAAQTFEDWELLVIDDGSTDDTRQCVEQLARSASGRLRYFYQENRGLSAARNAAIVHARGDIFAILDVDDIWLPQRLEKTVALLDAQPKTGIVHARVARVDENRNIHDHPFVARQYAAGQIAPWVYSRKITLWCPTVTFRRECVDKVGGFDVNLRSAEDRDMWVRISTRYRAAFVDEVLAYYRITPGSMSKNSSRMLSAQLEMLAKYRGNPFSERIYREGMASVLKERGDRFLDTNLRWDALGCFARAALYSPWEPLYPYVLLKQAVMGWWIDKQAEVTRHNARTRAGLEGRAE